MAAMGLHMMADVITEEEFISTVWLWVTSSPPASWTPRLWGGRDYGMSLLGVRVNRRWQDVDLQDKSQCVCLVSRLG